MKMSLKALRVNVGLTQDQLAHRMKVSKKTVCRWEKGETFPPADKIDALCSELNAQYGDIKWTS